MPTYFASAADFRAWLAAHAASAGELLVGFHKVGSGRPSMTWPQAVDEALCVGWIDGVRRRIDDTAYSIRFTPRRRGSTWSAVNIARIAVLAAEGRLQPAGHAAFDARLAERSRVFAYEQPAMPVLAPDAEATFRADAAAWAFFNAQPAGYRQRELWRVVSAKRADTQARRLALLIAASAQGRRL